MTVRTIQGHIMFLEGIIVGRTKEVTPTNFGDFVCSFDCKY